MYNEIARSLEKQYNEEELKEHYPVSWLLLELVDENGYAGKALQSAEELDWEKILKEHLQFEK